VEVRPHGKAVIGNPRMNARASPRDDKNLRRATFYPQALVAGRKWVDNSLKLLDFRAFPLE
jgi:hypothetical protein